MTVYARRGHDWTNQFAAIAKAAAKLDVRDAIIDGEATVLGSTAVADFQALRRELCKHHGSPLTFSAFDLLYLDGQDLRDRPLIERKEALRRILKGAPKTLVYVDHFEAEGESVFGHACRMKLEGIIAKRRGSKIVAFVEKPGVPYAGLPRPKSRSNRMNWRQWTGGNGRCRTCLGAEMPCAALA